ALAQPAAITLNATTTVALDRSLSDIVADYLDLGLAYWEHVIGRPLSIDVGVSVENLNAGYLGFGVITATDYRGRPTGGLIRIDMDADGWGWYLDATPLATEEFLAQADFSYRMSDPHARGQFDLFTVVLHELGHIVG